ncbi:MULTISPECIES: HNH endonuclease [unclassified Mammaliicoccus]|uniref:HNH endonuclease n=2 Tax=Mammaliicoccus TaxID=2803850 RepID=UPI001EFB4193|nr:MULTISPECIES: HNH endonuclease [unclassified Mammaliicoccus]
MTQEQLQEHRKQSHKAYNEHVRYKRDKRSTDLYQSTQWRKKRKQALIRDNHMCQICLRNGLITNKNLIVHHKIELKEDWSKRLALSNLETVCRECHNRIHKLK